MRLLRPALTLFSMLFIVSCLILPPAKGPKEGEPDPDAPKDDPAQVEEPPPPRDEPAEPGGEEEPPPPPPAPPKAVNDLVKELGAGPWVHLGMKEPGFDTEKGVVRVTRKKGGFSELTFIVGEADLEISKVLVVFGNGDRWNPKVRHQFKAGSRTRRIDLPGKARFIRKIMFEYASTDKGAKAQLNVFGKQMDKPVKKAEPPKPADDKAAAVKPAPAGTNVAATAPAGAVTQNPWPEKSMAELTAELGKDDPWQILGSREISEGETEISIEVGKDRGKFLFIAIGATGGEFKLMEWVVHFEDGTEHSAKVKHTFKTNFLTRRLAFPGGARKEIKNVRFLISSVADKATGHIHLFGLQNARKK